MKNKGHNDKNFIDKQSISLVENILAKHKRVMSKLEAIDKWPNIDGWIELQDREAQVTGRFFVQVKTLPQTHNNKILCPVSFLTNCDINPCFLFAVDNNENKFYWKYIDSGYLKTIKKLKINISRITLPLTEFGIISNDSTEYISLWETINADEQSKRQEFDQLKTQLEDILNKSNKAIGNEKQEFINIHKFLDKYNYKLENDFSKIKQIFYPNTWKMGLALYDYNSSSLGYTLFPIEFNKNDVQIKEIDKNLHDKYWEDGLGFTMHTVENPLETRMDVYINELLFKKVEYILKNKMLDHYSADLLATEFIIAFIDRFRTQLGLEKKDTYTVNEIDFAINKYFPLWIDETIKLLSKINRNGFTSRYKNDEIPLITPSVIISEIMLEERDIIAKNVSQRIQNSQYDYKTVNIKISELPLRIFLKFFKSIKDNKVISVKRIFKPLDHTRGNYLYNLLSVDDAKYNSEIFFSNIHKIYNEVVNTNFPLLSKNLNLWAEFNSIYYSLDLKASYQNDSPTARFFFLNGKQQSFKEITPEKAEILNKEIGDALQKKTFIFEFQGNEINIKDKAVTSITAYDYIYKETPFLDFIYNYLEESFKKLLK